MKVDFNTRKLAKVMQEDKAIRKAYGTECGKKLMRRLKALAAAQSLGDFLPPYKGPERCHEISGGRELCTLSVDLKHPYRLLFTPDHNPLPERPEGGLDWCQVTAIVILRVEDTMVTKTGLGYESDYVVSPGEIIDEHLDALAMTQKELAKRTGLSQKTISGILNAREPVTLETALKFERVLGRPAHFWVNVEQQYQEDKLRLVERQRLAAKQAWAAGFPFAEMARRGWLPDAADKADRVNGLLTFFGIASPEQWDVFWGDLKVAYRKTARYPACREDLSAWLRRGELEALQMDCAPFNATQFRAALAQIRGLTTEQPETFQPRLVALCAAAGVAVVFVPALAKSRASGCTRWLGDKALIQLSLRYKTNDHLWFTFFHEAGHILLHGKKAIFVEGNGLCDEREDEANAFAVNALIPKRDYASFLRAGQFTGAKIRTFARQQGVAAGIIVGRLQHDGHIPYASTLNKLKVSFRWAKAAEKGADSDADGSGLPG